MYFQKFEIGHKFYLEPIAISLQDIYEFANKYNPLPIHVDSSFTEIGVDYLNWWKY